MTALKDMPISFPGLFGDWEFTAGPKMLDIGHGVYWYGVIIAVGLLLAVLFCMKKAPTFGVTEDNVIDLAMLGTPISILGARIYYVVFYLSQFQNPDGSMNWRQVIAIWDGGIAIYGAVIGAFLTGIVYCKVKKVKFAALADLCVMGLLIGQAIGRWGNFMNREAFGAETTFPWRMRLWVSGWQYIEVHPTFLYESLWNLVGLLLIWFVITKARRFDGENTCFYFLWYGLGRLWIEGLRTDSLYLFGWTLFGQPIRVSQALSLVLVIGAALVLFYNIRLHPHSPEELLVNQVAARAAAEAAEAGEAPGDPADEGTGEVKAAAGEDISQGEENAHGDIY